LRAVRSSKTSGCGIGWPSQAWLLVEWPERSPALMARCDLRLDLKIVDAQARSVTFTAATATGAAALAAVSDLHSNKRI
jgi:tRNA A37 threonylcarbamoyladenosine biosynthesis protein TsaE